MGLPAFDASLPDDFSGVVRLFPLPNLVLFPNVVQALHIFEPRYCDMLQESLATDKLIAMALLKPGWEPDYMGKPRLYQGVCIGRILTHTPTPDHRHNILLAGVKRARIVNEIESPTSFRKARVETLEDNYASFANESRDSIREDLLGVIGEAFAHQTKENLLQLFTNQIPLGILADVIAYGCKLPLAKKQELLEQESVEERCRILLQHLRNGGPVNATSAISPASSNEPPPFPPPFSNN